MKMQRRAWMTAALLGLAWTLSGCDAVDKAMKPGFKGLDITGSPWGKQLELTDQNGQRRSLKDFSGKVVMLYFGFVQCPDVCPTALNRASEVMRALGPDAQRVQLLFVTVDPERDTPEMLKEYMAAFDPSFLALTGTAAEIRKAADEFKIYYKQISTGSSYTMDHTASTYLFDAQGNLRIMLRHEQTADDYTADIRQLLSESKS